MFSIIYFLITAAGLFFGGKFASYATKRLKEEGYLPTFDLKEFKGKDLKGKLKDLLPVIPVLIALFVPIIHMVTAAAGAAAFKNEDNRDTLYEGLKKVLESTGMIVNDPSLSVRTYKTFKDVATQEVTEVREAVKEKEKEEEPIRTNQAATDYWARLEQEHQFPKMEFNFSSDTKEEEQESAKHLSK